MDTREYIESGILELYVYGLLDDDENIQVNELAKTNKEINDEIIDIEKSIIELSSAFSPFISASNFEKVKSRLEIKHTKVVEMKPRTTRAAYLGWAAALLLLVGIGYFYTQLKESQNQVADADKERSRLIDSVANLENKNKQIESVLSVIRDKNNMIVTLGGQAVAPDAYAKIHWNRETQSIYVDAAGLPTPPDGQVYQVWALKLRLKPTSIGLLENFVSNDRKVFPVSTVVDAEAFGITLEPAGGSEAPTMAQLYTLGKV